MHGGFRLFQMSLVAALALTACDSASSPTGPPSHPLAGTWSGLISESTNNLHCRVASDVNPVHVTAEISVDGTSGLRATLRRPDGPSCTGFGSFDDSTFSLRFDPCDDLFTGRVTCCFSSPCESGPVSSLDWSGSWSGTKVEGTGWARSTGAGGGAAGLRISVVR